MKSIQSKFIALTLGCVLLCSLVIGGAGILNASRAADIDSAKYMNLQCSERAGELDGILSRIEQSVKTLSVYTTEQLDSLEQFKHSESYLNAYTKRLEEVAVNAANNTEGALAVYVRFNPELVPPKSGLFWSKKDLKGSFEKLTPTDFSSYSPEDVEHVGWYYIPVKNGKATWMAPYQNKNINARMISYVIPIYKDNETIGVVGMDIDFSVIEHMIDEISVYKSGYAFLTDEEAVVMYHRNFKLGTSLLGADASLRPLVDELENGSSGTGLFSYTGNEQKKKLAFRTLRNGMKLALAAPVGEIDGVKYELILQMLIALGLIAAVSVLLTIFMTRQMIRPLRELTDAPKRSPKAI